MSDEEAPQADEKPKRKKIDLKSRLSSVRAAAGGPPAAQDGGDPLSFPPPPPVGGSVPPPRGLSGPGPGAFAAPSPFAPPEPEVKPTAQAQTIKIEMSEEVEQQRKAAGKRSFVLTLFVALVATGAGFGIGNYYGGGAEQRKAVTKAPDLIGDIKKANETMATLSDALGKGLESLNQDTFPADLSGTLKSTQVPFTAQNFDGRGVGGLPGEVLSGLIRYVGGVEKVNDQKNKLNNLLGLVQGPLEKYYATKKKPVVNFSVVFSKQQTKTVAELTPHKEPFVAADKWPESYTVTRLVSGKPKETEVVLWDGKADLFAEGKPQAIPMEESTVSGFTDKTVKVKLQVAIVELKELLDGNQSPVPQQQTDGMLKEGEKLIETLQKIKNAR